MSLGLFESVWPTSRGSCVQRAFEFQADRYAAWLTAAGAQPRFSFILSSGPHATAELMDILTAHDIEVLNETATDERPLPLALVQHKGTHFNRRLFVIDGFDAPGAVEIIRTLDAQHHQVKRIATWAAFLVESTSALANFWAVAPNLIRERMETCLVMHEADARGIDPPAPVAQVKAWAQRGMNAEVIFAGIKAESSGVDYDQISRVLRSGYGHLVTPDASLGSDLIMSLWRDGVTPDLGDLNPDVLAAVLRHGELPALFDPGLSALGSRVMSYVAANVADQNSPAAVLSCALSKPGQVQLTLNELEILLVKLLPQQPWSAVVLQCALARVAADRGELERCVTALRSALESAMRPGVSPELQFQVLESNVKLQVGLGERGGARSNLDRMESLSYQLCSPYYSARHLLIRGDFIVGLDRNMALGEYRKAERMFSAHGYESWSQAALRRQEST